MPKQNLHSKDATAGAKYKGDHYEVDESMLFAELPEPPDTLPEGGHFYWNYYGGLLLESKVLSRMFVQSLSNYCYVCYMIEAYQTKINEEGLFIPIPRKTPKHLVELGAEAEYIDEIENPLVPKLQKMLDQHERLATSLGFTPYGSRVLQIDASGVDQQVVATSPPDVSLPETIPFIKEA